jgi:hypothetical protein
MISSGKEIFSFPDFCFEIPFQKAGRERAVHFVSSGTNRNDGKIGSYAIVISKGEKT